MKIKRHKKTSIKSTILQSDSDSDTDSKLRYDPITVYHSKTKVTAKNHSRHSNLDKAKISFGLIEIRRRKPFPVCQFFGHLLHVIHIADYQTPVTGLDFQRLIRNLFHDHPFDHRTVLKINDIIILLCIGCHYGHKQCTK